MRWNESLPNHTDVPIASKKEWCPIRIGRLAENDLLRAAVWYAERHPSGDSPFQKTFRDALDVLSHFPLIGRTRVELRAELRSLIAHPYVIFYRVDASPTVVTILRILHGRMDLDPSEMEDTD